MRILVTGGGGFLGLAVVEQLLAAGYEVRTYSRGHYPRLEKLGVDHQRGDLSDEQGIRAALQNCDAVFHVGAKVGMWGRYADFYAANVTGTEHILKECRAQGIRHLVFTSSPSVVFQGGSEGGDERLPYAKKYDAWYPQTKAIAERAVLEANDATLHTCALRPHLVWGPRDHHFLPRLLERRKKGRLRLPGSGMHLVDTIYIDNAARAHLQAFEAMLDTPERVAGKAYFLSQDEPIPIREFIDRLLAAGGLPPVDKRIDPRLALAAAQTLQSVYRLLRISAEPPITPLVVKHLSSPHWYDISAAKRDFGYAPEVSIEEGMRRLRDWVKETRSVAHG